ncbi:VOC family protein [Cohnella lupini]|uniref:PhnB protein n=1 Tax=Cohnella lupini TaxID=1294267 RepID=A0A3D9INC6_9BACL|nr:VOC family protein [Cohnella lupini]RED63272.1 PhnB protein [Cohnella lupini]
MGNLKPFITSEDARSQAEFYLQSLGGEIASISTHGDLMGAQNEFKDKVMHMCVLVAGGNAIFMADAIEPFTPGTGISLALELPTETEASEAFAKLAVGGNVKYPIGLQPFGLFFGELTDKFGIHWMITAAPKW